MDRLRCPLATEQSRDFGLKHVINKRSDQTCSLTFDLGALFDLFHQYSINYITAGYNFGETALRALTSCKDEHGEQNIEEIG
jgi:hypothetical protein